MSRGRLITVISRQSFPEPEVVAANLATAIAQKGRQGTLFVDCTNSTGRVVETLFNVSAEKTLARLVDALPSLNESLLRGFFPKHACGLALVEGITAREAAKLAQEQWKEALQLLARSFGCCVAVASGTLDEKAAVLVTASDQVIVPCSEGALSLHNARELVDDIKELHVPLGRVRMLMFRCGATHAIASGMIEELVRQGLFVEVPVEAAEIEGSVNAAIPLVLSKPLGAFSVKLKEVAAKLLAVEPKEPESTGAQEDDDRQETGTGSPEPMEIKRRLHRRLVEECNNRHLTVSADANSLNDGMRESVRKIVVDLVSRLEEPLSEEERKQIVREVLDEALGLGCLEELLKEPGVTEIMVNGPDDIYVERQGKIHYSGLRFTDEQQLRTVIDRIVSPLGRRIDEASPLVDARLADGSRVNAVIPPLSLCGPSVTIRKFSQKKLNIEDLAGFGALVGPMAEFLRVCVRLRKNIIISGGTGSGKTTLLNVVASFIPEDERIVTIEDSAELRLPQKHVVRLEARPPSIEGKGEISIRRLMINALRMRPDRVVVGECRGAEALDMLQAMNTGHDGSLTTVHANSCKDSISRISTMVMMAGTELPQKAILEQIAGAVQVIVQLSRYGDGTRKVAEIAELVGLDKGEIVLNPLFCYEQKGVEAGKVVGEFKACGNLPGFYSAVAAHGLVLDRAIFAKGVLQ